MLPTRLPLYVAALAVGLAAAAHADGDANLAAFRPAAGSDGLITTEGARPLVKGDGGLELRLWADGAYKPVQIPASPTGRTDVIHNRVGGWVGLNLHVLGPLSLAAQLPVTINEFGKFNSMNGLGPSTSVNGIGDVRITPRLSILREESSPLNFAIQGSVEIPTGKTISMTTDERVSGELLFAASRLWGDDPRGSAFELLGNVYGRLRPDRELATHDINSGVGARLGAVVHTGDFMALVPARVFGEIEGYTWSTSFKETATPVEWRAGLGWCFSNVSLDLAGGAGLTDGITAPGWRFAAGLGYAPSRCGGEAKRIFALKENERMKNEAIARAAEEKAAREREIAEARAREAREAQERIAAEQRRVEAERLAAEQAARDAAEKAERDRLAREAAEREAAKTPAVRVTEEKIEILQKVEFATGKATLKKGSNDVLDQVAAVLKSHPKIQKLEVRGFTDNKGGKATNLKLSQRRADAVMKYLVNQGIDPSRLSARGFGEDQPIAPNDTADGREKNRRVEFQIIEPTVSEPGI